MNRSTVLALWTSFSSERTAMGIHAATRLKLFMCLLSKYNMKDMRKKISFVQLLDHFPFV